MDCGCDYNGFCSDITRTWPMSRKFTASQKLIYEIVLEAQKRCFNLIRNESSSNFNDLYREAAIFIGEKLSDNEILLNPGFSQADYYRIGQYFCPHHVSHHIGIYLHDCHTLDVCTLPIGNNMCFTVEPGIYINDSCQLVKPEYRGLGVRIEDCVTIVNNELCVLSESCPKDPDELEELLEK